MTSVLMNSHMFIHARNACLRQSGFRRFCLACSFVEFWSLRMSKRMLFGNLKVVFDLLQTSWLSSLTGLQLSLFELDLWWNIYRLIQTWNAWDEDHLNSNGHLLCLRWNCFYLLGSFPTWRPWPSIVARLLASLRYWDVNKVSVSCRDES